MTRISEQRLALINEGMVTQKESSKATASIFLEIKQSAPAIQPGRLVSDARLQ